MIKKLAFAIREYKGHSIASALLILGEVVMEVIIPLLTAKLIDNGISKGDMKYVLTMGGLVALCCIVSLFFGIAAGRSASIASTGFAKNLRHDMFEKIQSYSFRNIDKFSSSSLVTRMTTDVNRLQDAYQMLIRIALRSPGMLIFSLIMALLADSKLALIFIAAIPILALGLYFIMTKAHPIFEKMFKTYDKLNRVVQENLRGIRVVKAFVREDHETEKFKDVSGDISKMAVRAEKILAYNSPMMNMTVYICTLLITYICAKLIMGAGNEDGMSIGTMQQLLTYTMQILMSLMMLSMIFVSLVMSRASAERVVEVLNEESTVVSPENAETEVKNGEIEFKNVSFAYHEGKDCLHDVNLKIASGETIGIIGGTGSSKSTLVQLIPRLYDTTKGEVYVGGRNVKDYDVKALRDSVAMVLQKNVLFSGTIKDNLRWGNEQATDEEMKAACVAACA
ncbi:MAG: ABC transporter ATP-binding protein, partial [Clostridiales bacterium]|nr:ABC transporter ATP-binding protein [Candidatus Coliplasma equi]